MRLGRTARFCSRCGAAQPAATLQARAGRGPVMERRHLTVLFCDLVGSTALSAALEPEDLAEIIIVYREVMQARVASEGGTVGRYIGDALLAYFGYPYAHDDDAARAIRAGLAMVDALPGLNARFAPLLSAPLRVRIGINSGLVLIEVKGGSGAGLADAGAIGKTPNVAARLQELAAPNTCLVTGETYALTATQFEFEPMGDATVKGVAGTVPVFRPLRDRRTALRRAQDRRAGSVVGRAREFRRLCELWAAARSGAGHAVLLTGDAGIGKTFLAEQLRQRAHEEGALTLLFSCQLDATHSPFRAVLSGLQRQFFVAHGSATAKVRRLQRTLSRAGMGSGNALALLCELFSLPTPEGVPRPKLTTEGRLKLVRDLLLARLEALAAMRPVFVLVENAHWADPSSEEWLSELVRRVPSGKLMVLVTARPHFQPSWQHDKPVTRVRLERLDHDNQELLLAALEAGHQLGAEVRRTILERSDGVPLYLEELFKTVAESGVFEETARDKGVPGSLRGMLTARLDRLGPAKPIALAASVIGRHFTLDLLRALRPTAAREIEPGLAALVGADIVRPGLGRNGTQYSFKHALLRDAAYEGLLTTERRTLHGKLAQAYLKLLPATVDEQPEIVAQHASLGGLGARAVALWKQAGAHALRRSAYREATAHFRRALADAEQLAKPMRPTDLARLCTDLVSAMIGAEGFAAPEVERLSVRAHQLCAQPPDTDGLVMAVGGLTTYYQVRGPLSQARQWAERLVALAQQQDDPARLNRALRRLGWCRFTIGDVAEGKRLLQDALARHEARARAGQLTPNDIDAGVIGYVNLGWAESFAGNAERALALCEAGQELAVSTGERPMDLAYALCMSAATRQVLGDRAATQDLARRAGEVADRNALPYWGAWSTVLLGWAMAEQDPAGGLRTILRGLAAYRATGARLFVPYCLGLAADASLRLGRLRMGFGFLDRADRETGLVGVGFSEPSLIMTRAALLRADGRPEEAAVEQRRAIRLARQQGSLVMSQAEPAETETDAEDRLVCL